MNDQHAMVVFASMKLLAGLETIVDECGAISGCRRSLCTLNEKHSQAQTHALIGGLALKPPLHGHQQAFTIVESIRSGSSGGRRHGRV